MRILFISNDKNKEASRRKQLEVLSERWSLLFVYSITEAENYIKHEIIGSKQKGLDLIIADHLIGIESSTKFFETIRFNIQNTYSRRDFNFREIPTSIIFNSRRQAITYYTDSWSQNSFNQNKEEILPIKQYIDQIKNWRRQVFEEMQNLGIRLNNGKINYEKFFEPSRRFKTDTKILTTNFKMVPRILRYTWLEDDIEQIKIIIDKFIRKLKRSMRSKKREEKKYHKFFNENLSLIKRDSYSQHFYEPKLYYTKKRSVEPDYVLKPQMTFETELSILEVKLPNELIVKKKKSHQSLRSSFIDHICQVNDYAEYLEAREHRSEISRVFGFVPEKIDYNILIGRDDHREENEYIISKRMGEYKRNINIITYDDLKNYQIKYLERLEMLQIKH